jgi:hypothetical protein
MESVDTMIRQALNSPPTHDNGSCLSAQGFQALSQCALLPRILQTYIFGQNIEFELDLLDIRLLLDIPWADLRAAMCPLRHFIGCADPEGVCRLLWLVVQHLSPETIIRQLLLELARGCIRLLSSLAQRLWCVQFRKIWKIEQTDIY